MIASLLDLLVAVSIQLEKNRCLEDLNLHSFGGQPWPFQTPLCRDSERIAAQVGSLATADTRWSRYDKLPSFSSVMAIVQGLIKCLVNERTVR